MADQILQVPSQNDGLLGGGGIGALLIGALLFGGGLGGFGAGRMGGPAAAAVATDVVLNPAFQSLQTQIQTLAGTVASNELGGQINELQATVGSNNIAVLSGIKDNANLYLQGQASLQTAQAAGNFTTLQSINGLGATVTAQSNQNALQQLNSFNNLTTTTLQGFNGAAMQVQNVTNQIIAQGTALSAQLAECCCQTQIAIKADGDATRGLINDLNVQNLRDQLAAANNQVSNNNQNQYLLQTILAHLAPRTVVS